MLTYSSNPILLIETFKKTNTVDQRAAQKTFKAIKDTKHEKRTNILKCMLKKTANSKKPTCYSVSIAKEKRKDWNRHFWTASEIVCLMCRSNPHIYTLRLCPCTLSELKSWAILTNSGTFVMKNKSPFICLILHPQLPHGQVSCGGDSHVHFTLINSTQLRPAGTAGRQPIDDC